jgi:hypothetical protein
MKSGSPQKKIDINKMFVVACVAIIALTLIKGYVYSFVLLEYPVDVAVSCVPEEENCFMYEENEEEPYKYMTVNAYDLDSCEDPEICAEQCSNLSECSFSYCSEDVVGEGERCFNFESYE